MTSFTLTNHVPRFGASPRHATNQKPGIGSVPSSALRCVSCDRTLREMPTWNRGKDDVLPNNNTERDIWIHPMSYIYKPDISIHIYTR